jgi:hypothetical protein
MAILEVKPASALHTITTYASNMLALVLLMMLMLMYLLHHNLILVGH